MRLLIKSKLIFVYLSSMCGNRLPHFILFLPSLTLVVLFTYIYFPIRLLFLSIASVIVCLHNTFNTFTQAYAKINQKHRPVTVLTGFHSMRWHQWDTHTQISHVMLNVRYSISMTLTNHFIQTSFWFNFISIFRSLSAYDWFGSWMK